MRMQFVNCTSTGGTFTKRVSTSERGLFGNLFTMFHEVRFKKPSLTVFFRFNFAWIYPL
jgi:hypothetical protein